MLQGSIRGSEHNVGGDSMSTRYPAVTPHAIGECEALATQSRPNDSLAMPTPHVQVDHRGVPPARYERPLQYGGYRPSISHLLGCTVGQMASPCSRSRCTNEQFRERWRDFACSMRTIGMERKHGVRFTRSAPVCHSDHLAPLRANSRLIALNRTRKSPWNQRNWDLPNKRISAEQNTDGRAGGRNAHLDPERMLASRQVVVCSSSTHSRARIA